MGQSTTLSCGILVRSNYVTNRCPRARQVACIRCRRPREWASAREMPAQVPALNLHPWSYCPPLNRIFCKARASKTVHQTPALPLLWLGSDN
jgi:hypothetical protein